MIYPKIPLAQSIIELCLAKGVTQIIISPGSRNAPLTIGFTNNPAFSCYSIADERCAGFFAMGIAQQTQKPTALVCTSGSALLNYYPAFAEAFYSQIPLIVISADRPSDKIDIGDGQTIRQVNVFENHSLYNANLSEEASEENDLKINQAINLALAKKGPVHINAPFEEPLYQTVTELSVKPEVVAVSEIDSDLTIDENTIEIWNSTKKKLVLIGVNNPNEIDPSVIEFLANDPSIIVMTETTSNVHHPSFLSRIDTIITPFDENHFLDFQPELLITMGGMLVSKRIKAFLRNYKPENHWHIDSFRAYDTFGCLTRHFEVRPSDFFKEISPKVKNIESDYFANGQKVKQIRAIKQKEYLNAIPFSDLKVFERVLSSLPNNIMLQISNSSAIRYAQLFDIDASISVFCNRGTSGIDGSTSTAIGASIAKDQPTILITGDISFLYDSNALWNNYIPKNFKIILINNRGGGIFRILPGHQETPVFNTYFETSHCLTAELLAKMYGFDYKIASDNDSLSKALASFYDENEKPKILEIFTPTLENDKILSQYFKAFV